MKIYTKRGDKGETSLLGGTRLSKAALRIEAYGTVDELNSVLAFLYPYAEELEFLPFLQEIQSTLFTIGAYLAADPQRCRMQLPELSEEEVKKLEDSIDAMEAVLKPLRHFILPGGHPANAYAHLARCVCRRAERRCVALNEKEPIHPVIIPYLNRLSDWLFVLARYFAHHYGCEEPIWRTR